jgi:hypothetical protein
MAYDLASVERKEKLSAGTVGCGCLNVTKPGREKAKRQAGHNRAISRFNAASAPHWHVTKTNSAILDMARPRVSPGSILRNRSSFRDRRVDCQNYMGHSLLESWPTYSGRCRCDQPFCVACPWPPVANLQRYCTQLPAFEVCVRQY